MDNKDINELVGLLRSILISRGMNVTNSNDDTNLLTFEIQKAIDKVNECRRFVPTETKLYPKKYKTTIISLAVCSFAKIGAEGQTSHSENNITRNYTTGGDYPQDILDGIVPLAK